MLQPPGSETAAQPRRANSGPSTQKLARIKLTVDWTAVPLLDALAEVTQRTGDLIVVSKDVAEMRGGDELIDRLRLDTEVPAMPQVDAPGVVAPPVPTVSTPDLLQTLTGTLNAVTGLVQQVTHRFDGPRRPRSPDQARPQYHDGEGGAAEPWSQH